MTIWNPSENYQKIAEANRTFYSQNARQYDATENCVSDHRIQSSLEADLDRVISFVGKPALQIRALDACGGSGNISLKLLKRGVKVKLADISPDLQEIFRTKCHERGLVPETVCSEIASFLAQTEETFDLVVFSSALHHLENINQVLALAFKRLNPGGIVFTTFDPTRRDRISGISKMLCRAEYYYFKVMYQTRDLPQALARRIRRILSGSNAANKSSITINNDTAGMLAEYHVEKGINDLELVVQLQKMGFEVIAHERRADTRFAWVGRMVERLGDVTSFKLILRKPGQSN
jgi:2-polyprenyl-3-methyl-5-hydroxy-6-metoxy-1,4-benzoquinol methylase